MKIELFKNQEGFTTVGMAVALLISLTLLFSSAQIYRLNSASAEIQEVADASALAAENLVAEFMVGVRLCDALVLSTSLLGATAYGLGVVALCIPSAGSLGEKLIEMGHKVFEARDSFASQASHSLNEFQKALPFLAALNAQAVAAANNRTGLVESSYFSAAVLVPGRGKPLDAGKLEGADELGQSIEEKREEIQQRVQEIDEVSEEANAIKYQAFLRDCGDESGYCLRERAAKLASLSASDNPSYESVDAWSFSVALKRAQKYYPARWWKEAPADDTVAEKARSVLRKRFYEYAAREVFKGYVRETDSSFEAFFPRLPRNAEELKATPLYSEKVYPVSRGVNHKIMHAWSGCPLAARSIELTSISQFENETFEVCEQCQFTSLSLGSVASASAIIENGFEYHYVAIADAAEAYQRLRSEIDPQVREVKEVSGSLLEECSSIIKGLASKRIKAKPPGSYGCIALMMNPRSVKSSEIFPNPFVKGDYQLGARAAVSGATLLEDCSDEEKTVLNSLLDNFDFNDSSAVGATRVLLDCWSGMLRAYGNGQEGLVTGLEKALDSVPLLGDTGLGNWAAKKLRDGFRVIGLEPAKLYALKPVLVNTSLIAGADDGSFATAYKSIQQKALNLSDSHQTLFSALLETMETDVFDSLEALEPTVEIARIDLPFIDASIPITLTLPISIDGKIREQVKQAGEALSRVSGSTQNMKVWE